MPLAHSLPPSTHCTADLVDVEAIEVRVRKLILADVWNLVCLNMLLNWPNVVHEPLLVEARHDVLLRDKKDVRAHIHKQCKGTSHEIPPFLNAAACWCRPCDAKRVLVRFKLKHVVPTVAHLEEQRNVARII